MRGISLLILVPYCLMLIFGCFQPACNYSELLRVIGIVRRVEKNLPLVEKLLLGMPQDQLSYDWQELLRHQKLKLVVVWFAGRFCYHLQFYHGFLCGQTKSNLYSCWASLGLVFYVPSMHVHVGSILLPIRRQHSHLYLLWLVKIMCIWMEFYCLSNPGSTYIL